MISPILILGGGGHAKVLIEALRLRSVTILGILDADPAKIGKDIHGIRIIGSDAMLSEYAPAKVHLVNGIGSIRQPRLRKSVFEAGKRKGFCFVTVVHPSAILASDVVLGEGVQIMAGSVIQPGTRIGANTIVNTGTSVDHDCVIGDHVHLAPGVTISGTVQVGDAAHIGAGATVIQCVTIGRESLIGAGSVVVADVLDRIRVVGVPARQQKSRHS